jgi:hypothetical protein
MMRGAPEHDAGELRRVQGDGGEDVLWPQRLQSARFQRASSAHTRIVHDVYLICLMCI